MKTGAYTIAALILDALLGVGLVWIYYPRLHSSTGLLAGNDLPIDWSHARTYEIVYSLGDFQAVEEVAAEIVFTEDLGTLILEKGDWVLLRMGPESWVGLADDVCQIYWERQPDESNSFIRPERATIYVRVFPSGRARLWSDSPEHWMIRRKGNTD